MAEIAIRRQGQRRAHRAADQWYTACAMRINISWVSISLAYVDADDRCRRCWPTSTTHPAEQPERGES